MGILWEREQLTLDYGYGSVGVNAGLWYYTGA